ncbi:hypothetical protein Ae201684_013382 [Aphanomyces euteiches]|uniref:Uncharacterized protein n=1 Tax=Aphanomyces euteiches TaxID=100861 RepID=A0A6G0WN84_9STRA|nr:hypothetical protein Ae201684_013382 [Aphanomyces euteiches]
MAFSEPWSHRQSIKQASRTAEESDVLFTKAEMVDIFYPQVLAKLKLFDDMPQRSDVVILEQSCKRIFEWRLRLWEQVLEDRIVHVDICIVIFSTPQTKSQRNKRIARLAGMLPSRRAAPKSAAVKSTPQDHKKRKWQLHTYLESRDFQGGITLLRFQAKQGEASTENTLWSAYCMFHMGEYLHALRHYEEVLKLFDIETCLQHDINCVLVNIACCYLYLNYFDLAKQALTKIQEPEASIVQFQHRLRLILGQRVSDSDIVTPLLASQVGSSRHPRDQLATAAVLYQQRNFQGAIDIYKRLVAKDESQAAIQVYLAMCYYHLEYYDISLEMLASYMSVDSQSIVAKNLAACNSYHLMDGSAAEKTLDLRNPAMSMKHTLVEHNLVVFRNGERALRVWPSLVGLVPEAQLNLAIYHMKHDEMTDAFDLLESLDPAQPMEYILKAIVHMWMCQQPAFAQSMSNEHLFMSEKFFETVGTAPTECDTIRGRQAMACYYLLRKEFDTANVYLKSIAMYHVQDDAFNWNYGLAFASTGCFSEAETVLSQIQHPQLKQQFVYLAWLARCHIRSIQQSHLAWELYLHVQNTVDALRLLKLIANEYYLMADYFYAAKAFDVLERVDPDPEYCEAKRGACIGYFQKAVTGKCDPTKLREVLSMLDASKHSQGKVIARSLRAWCETSNLLDEL